MTSVSPKLNPPENIRQRPMAAIVGRPNVGKSSLFNCLVGRRTAIVTEIAGTTRDRLSSLVFHGDRSFLIVDTGGILPTLEGLMDEQTMKQVEVGLAEADVLIFVVDSSEGVTHGDFQVAERLRRTGRPVIIAVNKVDHFTQEPLALEFYQLGLGDPVPISAYHRTGIHDLVDHVVRQLPVSPDVKDPVPVTEPYFAIVGRPNVGKSALTNAILGEERSIVSPVPGTTRDAIDTPFHFRNLPVVLIDTAGIRRRGSIEKGIENYSVLRAIRAIDRSSVALLVLDATELVTAQDLHIAGQINGTFKGSVVVVNKWDLAKDLDKDEDLIRTYVRSRFRFMDHVPIVFTDALNGWGVTDLMDFAIRVHSEWTRWISPSRLQSVIMEAIGRHLPPRKRNSSMKIYRVKQESIAPPTFVFYCNNPGLMHFSYERYLENTIRDEFGFQGVHLRLEFRGKGKRHVIGGKQHSLR